MGNSTSKLGLLFDSLFRSNIEGRIRNRFLKEGYRPISYTEPQDIFIASYPKSGVTWMQNLLAHMMLETTSEHLSPKMVSELIPDLHAKNFYKRLSPVMHFKTHALPIPAYRRVIHLVRDPRDVYVSYYHFLNMGDQEEYSLDNMLREGKGLYLSTWNEHSTSWHDNPYNAEILTVRYEDLFDDYLSVLKKVAVFCGWSLPDALLEEIYKKNSLGAMRSKVETQGWDYGKQYGKQSQKFFRKGQPGGYKGELDQKYIKLIEGRTKNMMKVYGYVPSSQANV